MGTTVPLHHHTYADYLELEETSNVRHEFLAGEIYAMAGGTPQYAAVTATVTALLVNQLSGKGCRVYSSDLRVRVMATGLVTYPDITVVCGSFEADPENRHTAINPRLVVEILSDGTEKYARGDKLAHYQTIPSLAVVVLIASRERRVDLIRRGPDNVWTASVYGPGEVVSISELACQLVVNDIYAAVEEV